MTSPAVKDNFNVRLLHYLYMLSSLFFFSLWVKKSFRFYSDVCLLKHQNQKRTHSWLASPHRRGQIFLLFPICHLKACQCHFCNAIDAFTVSASISSMTKKKEKITDRFECTGMNNSIFTSTMAMSNLHHSKTHGKEKPGINLWNLSNSRVNFERLQLKT